MSPSRGQFAITQVQVSNWGGFADLQSIEVGRYGTALLGPSGRGKSTWLDAMASVIMPNPQRFNQAARDDGKGEQERTVYSYARGFVEHEGDGVDAVTSTPRYLRPPGNDPFLSGCAITFGHDDGRVATAFRLAWVGSDVVDQDGIGSATVYGFAHDHIDLESFNGLTSTHPGSGPLTPSSVKGLLRPERGDVADRSQGVVHAKMRQVLGLGDSEASQANALKLLRMIQASKGVLSINTLFKQFVLTAPKALERWESTLEHFTVASGLADDLDLVTRKIDALEDLSATTLAWRDAQRDASIMTAMAREPEERDALSRLQVWHWGKTCQWAEAEEGKLLLLKEAANDEKAAARLALNEAEAARERAMEAYSTAGGDAGALPRAQLKATREDLQRVEQIREDSATRLAVFDLRLPESEGDVALTKELIRERQERERERETELDNALQDLLAQRTRHADRRNELTKEFNAASSATDNLDPRARAVRETIARGSGVPANRLKYVGELLDIKPEYRGWQEAILAVLGDLPRDLLTMEHDYSSVRSWVATHRVGGRVSLPPPLQRTPRTPIDGTVPAMLDVADGPFHPWLINELVTRHSVQCVERSEDLDSAPLPTGVTGRVTRSGMRTGREGRVVKDDRERKYIWVGRDNQALRARLASEVTAVGDALAAVTEQVSSAKAALADHRRSMQLLERVGDELAWEAIDDARLKLRIAALTAELDAVDTEETRERRARLNKALSAYDTAKVRFDTVEKEAKSLQDQWAVVVSLKDVAQALLDAHEPVTDIELEAVSMLGYKEPDTTGLDPMDSEIDRRVAMRVADALKPVRDTLRHQADERRARVASFEQALMATLRAYRGINEHAAREIDLDLAAIPALEEIHRRLVDDALPQARTRLLEKLTHDLNTGLRALVTQIATDRRDIKAGLNPIREVLSQVQFRETSTLSIEALEVRNQDLKRFEEVVRTYTRANPLGVDLINDEASVEEAFKRLRSELDKLVQRGSAGEAWRKKVFDAREHIEFRAVEKRPGHDKPILHRGAAGMSGGEGQEIIAFLLGAALRYRLAGEHAESDVPPLYAAVVLDEGFVKADSDYTGRALAALQRLGFQLVIGAPREKASAFEDYIERVAYITSAPDTPGGVHALPMTLRQALELDEEGAA